MGKDVCMISCEYWHVGSERDGTILSRDYFALH
jgi:hypothetical protein